MEKIFCNYKKTKNKMKNIPLMKSYSLNKNDRKNIIKNEFSIKSKKASKKLGHQRTILFNKNKLSKTNINSTSTSSLSSSTDNNYLTPTKYNHELNELNIDNDYYFNECFTNKKNLFQSVNISRPKLNYENKLNKNLHLTLGSGINRYNYNNYYSENDYGTNKQLIINRTFKLNKNKNKLVLFRKIFVMNNNSKNNKDIKDLSSKSFENNNIHKKLYSTIGNIEGDNKINNNNNNRYNLIKEKKFLEKKEENENNNDININYNMQQKKYKNIVLRPHKIPKEKHLIDINNFKEIDLKNNIRVNKNKKEESPELIKKIIQKFNIKPKYSRVFK